MKLFQKGNIGAFSLGILCFQGFGLRIFQGVSDGAIFLWLLVLILLNIKYIQSVNAKYWLTTLVLLCVYVAFNALKGASFQSWVLVAMGSASVALTRYYYDIDMFVKDLRKLTKFCMYYDLLHIPIMVFLGGLLTQTSLGMEPKTFLYLFWFNNQEYGLGFNRIQGFCWEPSCWNLLLNLNLVFVLFYKEKKSQLVLSVIALLSTMSTTGMVTMVIVIFAYYLMNLNKKNLSSTIVTAGVILALIGPFVYEEFSNKMATGSGQTRGGDAAIALAVLYNRPMLGEDIDHITSVPYAMSARDAYWTSAGDYDGYMDQQFVNAVAGLMVEWGLPIFLLIVVLISKSPLFPNKKLKYLYLLAIFLVLMGTPIARTGFFYLLPFSTLLLPKRKFEKEI